MKGGHLPGAVVVAHRRSSLFRTPAGEPIGESIEKAVAQLHRRGSPRKGSNLHGAHSGRRRSSLLKTLAGEHIDAENTKIKAGAQLRQRGSPRKRRSSTWRSCRCSSSQLSLQDTGK